MTWSIDTSISFITLLLTGTWSFLQIWNYVATYWRAQSQDSSTEASVAGEQGNISHEILLESGLVNTPGQPYGPELALARRTQSA